MMSSVDLDIDPDDFTFLGEFAGGQMWIRPAVFEQDHEAIDKVAKQSPVGAAILAAGRMGEGAYSEGGVRVLVDVEEDGTQRCVGFSVFSLTDDGEALAVLLLAVDENERRKGCGRELLEDLRHGAYLGPVRRYSSTLPPKSEAGLAFSLALGFTENGRTARGGIRLHLEEW